MFEWIKRRRLLPADIDRPQAGGLKTPGRPMSGKYLLLYEYLEHRYANSVVLTFAQIEDVVGFALPEQARVRREWWTDATQPTPGPDMQMPGAWRAERRGPIGALMVA